MESFCDKKSFLKLNVGDKFYSYCYGEETICTVTDIYDIGPGTLLEYSDNDGYFGRISIYDTDVLRHGPRTYRTERIDYV